MKIEKYWIDPRRDQNPFRKWWSKRTIHWMVWQTKRFIVWMCVFIRRTWSSFGGFSLHNAQAQSDVMKLTDDGRHIVVFSISIRLYSRYLFVLFRLPLLLLFDKHCDAHVPRDHSIPILRHVSTWTRKASQLNSRVIPKNGKEMLWQPTTEVSSAAYIVFIKWKFRTIQTALLDEHWRVAGCCRCLLFLNRFDSNDFYLFSIRE